MEYCGNDYCARLIPCSVHEVAEQKQDVVTCSSVAPVVSLIDVHIHLLDSAFDADRESLLVSARERGVVALVVVSETVDQATSIIKYAPQWSLLLPVLVCCGVHPCHVHTEPVLPMLAFIRSHRASIAGVGEIGLDFTPHVLRKQLESIQQIDVIATEDTVKQLQRDVFEVQLRLAMEFDLPINVHSRNAGHHAIAMAVSAGVRRAVFHAFDGKPPYAEKAAREHGYLFSVPPSVQREMHFQKLVRVLPLSHLVLETDAPALPPVNKERNVPMNLTVSCHEVARIKEIDFEMVAAITTQNARRLFCSDTRGTPVMV